MIYKEFGKLSKLVKIILLLIPGVNWVTEILVRWSSALNTKSTLQTVVALLVTIPTGIAFGWLDLVWILLFDRLLFTSK